MMCSVTETITAGGQTAFPWTTVNSCPCVRGMKMYHFIESVTISLILEAVSAAADTMSAIYLHADLVSIAIDTC